MSALLRANGIDPASDKGAALVAGMGLPETPPVLADFLLALAVRLRVAGVAWTWRDLEDMRAPEREAVVLAGEQAITLEAAQAARAASGPLGLARVLSALDGGAALAALEKAQEAQAFGAMRAAVARGAA